MRRRLGVEGRKTAEQYYGWEKSAQKLDSLYQKYIREGKANNRQPAVGSEQ
jgi:hypothetical protein